MYAPNFVHTPSGSVTKDTKGEIDGWRWFDSEFEAYTYFGLSTPSAERPDEVTRMQAKIALKRAGLLPTIEQVVAAADEETQMMWAEALHFRRTSPLLNQLATAIGMSSQDMDDLFALAKTIEP